LAKPSTDSHDFAAVTSVCDVHSLAEASVLLTQLRFAPTR
jgi:hypothetical protein